MLHQVLPKISAEQLKLGAKVNYGPEFEIFKGTLRTSDGDSKEVMVRKYHHVEIQSLNELLMTRSSFNDLIKSTSIILTYAKEFYVPFVGINEDSQYTVTLPILLLDNLLETQRLSVEKNEQKEAEKKPLPLDNITKIRIMYDVARYIEAISKTGNVFRDMTVLEREIITDNIYLSENYLSQKADKDNMDVSPPAIAFIGEDGGGCGTIRSRRIQKMKHRFYHEPPYWDLHNDKQLNIGKMIWQWGILAFEIWTEAPFEKFTEEDCKRIIFLEKQPLKMDERAVYKKWNEDSPNVLHEVTQRMCWNPSLDLRPTPKQLVQIVKWAYMNALAGISDDIYEESVCEMITKKKAIPAMSEHFEIRSPQWCDRNYKCEPQDQFKVFLKICNAKEYQQNTLKAEFDTAMLYEDWVERLWQIKHPAHAHLYKPSDKKIADAASQDARSNTRSQDYKEVNAVNPHGISPREVKLKPDALSVLNNLIKEILPNDFQFIVDKNVYRLNLGASLMLPGVNSSGLAPHFVLGMKQIGISAEAKIADSNEVVDIKCDEFDSAKIDYDNVRKALKEFIEPFKKTTADLYYTCGNLAAENDKEKALKMWDKAKTFGHDAAAARIAEYMAISRQQRSGKLF